MSGVYRGPDQIVIIDIWENDVKLLPHVSSTQFVGFAGNPAIRNTVFHAFFITSSKDQRHCGHLIFSYDLRCGDQDHLL